MSNGTAIYLMFDPPLEQLTVEPLCVNSFALILQWKSPEDVVGPLSGADGVDPEGYSRTSGKISPFRFITYVLLDILYDAIENNALYELGTNCSDLNKLERTEND